MSGSTANSISDRNESGILYENVSCIVLMQFESTLSRYDKISLEIKISVFMKIFKTLEQITPFYLVLLNELMFWVSTLRLMIYQHAQLLLQERQKETLLETFTRISAILFYLCLLKFFTSWSLNSYRSLLFQNFVKEVFVFN